MHTKIATTTKNAVIPTPNISVLQGFAAQTNNNDRSKINIFDTVNK